MTFRLLSVGAASFLVSSFPLAQSAAAEPGGGSGPAGPIPLLQVQQGASPYFNKVVSRLDVGGKVLEYHDHEGRREMLVGLANAVVEAIPEVQNVAQGIDVGAVIDATGLAQAVASGESLIKDGDGWRARSYSYLPKGREGLAKLLGKEAFPFTSAKWLPSTTDLLLEARLDATTLPATLQKIAAASGHKDDLDQLLAQPGPGGDTVKGVVEKTNLHLTLGVDFSEWQEKPSAQKPIDFVVRIEGAGPLLKALQEDPQNDMGDPEVHGNRKGWAFDFPPSLQKEKAVLLYDEAGTLTFASRESYVEKTDGADGKLADSKTYRDATNFFPDSGNFLAYASPKATPVMRWFAATLLKEVQGPAGPVLSRLTGNLPAQPWSVCVACEPDGIYTVAKLPIRPEWGGATAAMPALSGSAVLFTGARAWKKGSDRAACIMNVRNVQQAVRSVQNISGSKTGDPIDWDEVWKYMQKPSCPAHGHYTFAKTYPKVGDLACTCDEEDHNLPGHEDW